MSSSNMRQAAVGTISKMASVAGKVNYLTNPLAQVYGEHVFSEAVQRQRLPKTVFRALQNTIKAGEELDPQIADAVAVAMKDWAIEHGRDPLHPLVPADDRR